MENNKRERGGSHHEQEITIEELTIMKLMEEIIEFDTEIKMKQSWINTRMNMLHKLLPKQENSHF